MENKGFQSDSHESAQGKDVEQKNGLGNGNLSTPISDHSQAQDGTVRMKRQIGLLGGTALIVGTMIGSGIFVSPKGVLDKTQSVGVSLCIWAACGLLSTFTAISYCELGTVVPRSGGEHAYFMATFAPMHKFLGQLPAFLMAWMTVILLKPSSLAIISLSFAQYAMSPVLTSSGYCDGFKETDDYKSSQKLIAVCIASIVALVNVVSAKLATRVQIAFTCSKILAMVIIIGVGIYNFSRGHYGDINGEIESTPATAGDIAKAFYIGLWAYEGWNNLNFVTEELENPSRNLPLSILIAIPLCTFLYLCVNVSYYTVLSKDELLNSEAVAVDVANTHLGVMNWVIPLLVTLSTIGSANGSMYTAGRISYVAGRDGHMVDFVSYVHSTKLTPVIAILINVVFAIPMIYSNDVNELIGFFSFAAWIIYGLALACVVILRKTMPDAPRPFRVPLIIPIIAVIVSGYLVIAPIIDDPQVQYFYVLGFFGLGILLYIPFVYYKYRLPFMDSLTKKIQFLTMVAPSPYKDD